MSTTFSIVWKILYVGQLAINGGFGATMEFSFLDTATRLTIRGQHIPTLELDMDKECQGCKISNLSTVKPTTFYFDMSFTRPMSRRLCKFWHHNNAYCSQRRLAIALDESNDASNVVSVIKMLEGNCWYEINTVNSEATVDHVLQWVKEVFPPEDPSTTVAVYGKKESVTIKSFHRLQDNRLNDDLMQFGSWHFYETAVAKQPSLRNSLKVLSTYFVTKLRSDTAESVFAWTKDFDVFELDYIAIPVHTDSRDHWYLMIVEYPSQVLHNDHPCHIVVLDSLGQDYTYDVQLVRNWLIQLAYKTQRIQHRPDIRHISTQVPQQSNDKDCGVYVLNHLRRYLEHPQSFSKCWTTRLNTVEIENKWDHSEVSTIRGVLQKALLELSFRQWTG